MRTMPKLSEDLLASTGDRGHCGNCGREGETVLWREHDERDRPTETLVALCEACSDEIVEPHPRLYARVDRNQPIPGAMPICVACAHRAGLVCRSPLLKANGGPGLPVRFPQPTVGFVDYRDPKTGRRRGERMVSYRAGGQECDGRAVQTSAPGGPGA